MARGRQAQQALLQNLARRKNNTQVAASRVAKYRSFAGRNLKGVLKMDLINRYLQAVKFWLPAKQKDDIASELAEDIRSQVEEQEAALGRKLNEAEVAAILKHHGRPLLVAQHYLPQRHLIGPVLFPIYVFVLKVVALFYMVPWIIAWIGIAISRSAHSEQSLLVTLASFWTSFWPTAFFMIGSI